MKNSKTAIYAAAGVSALALVGVLGTLGVSQVLAQSEDGEYPLIIQNLAEKFGVNESEVQAVFEDTREEHRDARLDAAVEDGTITEAQKAAITEMQDKMHTQIEAIRANDDLSDTEKREQMRAIHDEFRDWAEANGIELEDLRPEGMGQGRGGRMGGGEGREGREGRGFAL